MSSIFDTVRKALKAKAQPPIISPVPMRQPIQVNRSAMVRFGQSSFGQGLTNFQRNIEQRTLPKVNFTQYTNKIQNPTGRTLAGFGSGMAQDIVNLPQRLVEGGGRVGTQIVRPIQQGKRVNPAQAIGASASAFEPIFDIATLGSGIAFKHAAKQGVKAVGKQTFKQGVKKGALVGAGYGATFGGLRGLSQGNEATLGNFAQGTVGGGLLGAGLGGGTAGSAHLVTSAIRKVFPKATPQKVQELTRKYIQEEGRFQGSKKQTTINFPDGSQEKFYTGDVQPQVRPQGMKITRWQDKVKEVLKDERGFINIGAKVGKNDVAQPPIDDIGKQVDGRTVDGLMKQGYTKELSEFILQKRNDMLDVKSPALSKLNDTSKYTRISGNEPIKIYRVSSKGKDLEAGKFVFTSKEAAEKFRQEHGFMRGQPEIIEKTVKKSDLMQPSDKGFNQSYGEELIYNPQSSQPTTKQKILNTLRSQEGFIRIGAEVGGESPQVSAKSSLDSIIPQAKTAIEQPQPVVQASKSLSESQTVPQGSSSGDSITDPIQKIVTALKEAKPIRKEQEALYSAERAKRVARMAAVGQSVPGEQGYYAQLGQLKGELPKAQFEGIRGKLTADDINSVFDTVEKTAFFSPFEKLTAKTGLAKLLGKEGGTVPNESELRLLNEIFPPEFIKAAMGNRTGMQKIMNAAGQVLGVPRSLMAGGLDMSYGLRQGVFSGYSHPKQFASAFGKQFKYFASQKAVQELNDGIRAHPNYKLAREAGLALTDVNTGRLSNREEQFQSQLAEKIPGIGQMIKASGRAYTGFANKYRFDMFNSLVDTAKKTGDIDDPKFLKNAGELVNTLTGRGSLGKFEKSAGILSSTLFSPRLLASRLQLMNPQFYMKLQPAVRKEALKSLVAYVAGTATILGAADLAGAEVNKDITNSDFGKIKIGNTRVDVMGGFQQPLVLLGRLITGKVTSSTTGKTMTLGEGYKPMNRFDIIQRFFESKEAPIISFLTSAIKGQDAIGNKFNLSTEVVNRMVPMFIADLVDLYKDGGLSSLPLGVPAFFGAGGQTYGKTELVTGKNKLGQDTSQIRPIQGIGESLTEKIFGKQPLGTSSSTNVQAYYEQMLKLPREEASRQFQEIRKTNPELAKKIVQVAKDKQMGVTVDDQVLKTKGVASGDRAIEIADQFNKLKTRQEKSELWQHYVKVGIITKDVAQQLGPLLQK